MRKISPLLLLLLFSCSGAYCRPTSASQAEDAAVGWARLRPSRLADKVLYVRTFEDETSAPLFHVINLQPEGYVVVSADDLVEPIVAYSSTGTFDDSPQNPLYDILASDLKGRISGAKAIEEAEGDDPSDPRAKHARQEWEELEQAFLSATTTSIGAVSSPRVDPLLQTRWNQKNECGMAVYNYYTPPNAYGSTDNYYSGCVATALAQLMRYHQFPVLGVGAKSYNIQFGSPVTSRLEPLLGGNGLGGPYDWANMVADPDCAITLVQRQAIGALVHDAGTAVNMNYQSDGSSADTLASATALINAFAYSNAKKGWNNGATLPLTPLYAMVNCNLDARHPVMLGIKGSIGGHAVVCDGYGYEGTTAYHHLNLGWSGQCDAWYNLPTIDTSVGTFDSVYRCVYNVFTTGSGEIVSGRVLDTSGLPVAGAVVTATKSGKTYTTTTDSRGIYALAKVQSGSQYTVTAQAAGSPTVSQTVTTGTSNDSSTVTGNKWAIDFQVQSPVAASTLRVEAGANSTLSTAVTLDNAATGSPTDYLASESSSFTGASWQPYAAAPNFTLSSSEGVKTVYFKVRNSSGAESNVISDSITLTRDVGTLRSVKLAPDNSIVGISGLVVTAKIGSRIYVESPSRSAGIAVDTSAPPALDSVVSLCGTMGTSNGERFIAADSIDITGTGDIAPLGLPNVCLGGGPIAYDAATGAGQRGIDGASGLNNIGLLVNTWGTVTQVDTASRFYLVDDGSQLYVKVTVPVGKTLPNAGDFVSVTGISSCELSGSQLVRVVRVSE